MKIRQVVEIMGQKIIAKLAEIVEKNSIQEGVFRGQICTLSLIDEEGFPTSSIITPSKSDGLKGFFTGSDDPNYCVLKFTTKRHKYFSAKDGVEVGGVL
jgi:hypothetical protein